MKKGNVVIICGGSFQGKSLIALRIASDLKFSAVIATDAVRNLLKVLNPDQSYLSTSTYLLNKFHLSIQKNSVSTVIKEIIGIYLARGEHIIVEGMHLDEKFLEWAQSKNFLCLCINNELPIEDRIVLKNVTRSKLHFKCGGNMPIKVDRHNVGDTMYMMHHHRIDQIHQATINHCKKIGIEIISFMNIDDGIERALDLVRKQHEEIPYT